MTSTDITMGNTTEGEMVSISAIRKRCTFEADDNTSDGTMDNSKEVSISALGNTDTMPKDVMEVVIDDIAGTETIVTSTVETNLESRLDSRKETATGGRLELMSTKILSAMDMVKLHLKRREQEFDMEGATPNADCLFERLPYVIRQEIFQYVVNDYRSKFLENLEDETLGKKYTVAKRHDNGLPFDYTPTTQRFKHLHPSDNRVRVETPALETAFIYSHTLYREFVSFRLRQSFFVVESWKPSRSMARHLPRISYFNIATDIPPFIRDNIARIMFIAPEVGYLFRPELGIRIMSDSITSMTIPDPESPTSASLVSLLPELRSFDFSFGRQGTYLHGKLPKPIFSSRQLSGSRFAADSVYKNEPEQLPHMTFDTLGCRILLLKTFANLLRPRGNGEPAVKLQTFSLREKCWEGSESALGQFGEDFSEVMVKGKYFWVVKWKFAVAAFNNRAQKAEWVQWDQGRCEERLAWLKGKLQEEKLSAD